MDIECLVHHQAHGECSTNVAICMHFFSQTVLDYLLPRSEGRDTSLTLASPHSGPLQSQRGESKAVTQSPFGMLNFLLRGVWGRSKGTIWQCYNSLGLDNILSICQIVMLPSMAP